MGSMSSRIADDEEEERYGQMLARQRREKECQEAWERFLRGEGTELGNILEYARKLDEEVKWLRKEAEFSSKVRDTIRMFLDVR